MTLPLWIERNSGFLYYTTVLSGELWWIFGNYGFQFQEHHLRCVVEKCSVFKSPRGQRSSNSFLGTQHHEFRREMLWECHVKPLGATLYQQTASYRMGKDSTDPGFVVVSRLWSLPRLRNLTGIEIRIRLESIFLGNPNPNRNSNEQTKGIWIRTEIGMLNAVFVSESKSWLHDSNSTKKWDFLENSVKYFLQLRKCLQLNLW